MKTLTPMTAAKLFTAGFTIGPIVDSLHNQCLLKYNILPISIPWPDRYHHSHQALAFSNLASTMTTSTNTNVISTTATTTVAAATATATGTSELVGNAATISATGGPDHVYPYLFCSSWTVPPLLGIAYIVLGGILPRLFEALISSLSTQQQSVSSLSPSTTGTVTIQQQEQQQQQQQKSKMTFSLQNGLIKLKNNYIMKNDNVDKNKDATATATSRDTNPAVAIAVDAVDVKSLRNKAIFAVLSTALIIKLSEFLETHPSVISNLVQQQPPPQLLADISSSSNYFLSVSELNLLVMVAAVILQWTVLDGTIAALLAAVITSIGGPISELPFVANGVWEYLDSASDYFPLSNIYIDTNLFDSSTNIVTMTGTGTGADTNTDTVITWWTKLVPSIVWEKLLAVGADGDGEKSNYQTLALSSITGPCYFAVTLDAIALGRWFDAMESDHHHDGDDD